MILKMKNSSEPVWQQLRRLKGEKKEEKKEERSKDRATAGGTAANGGKAAAGASAAAAGASGGSGAGGSTKESQINKGRKLTGRLGKVSSQNNFIKEEVLDVLQKVGNRCFILVKFVACTRRDGRTAGGGEFLSRWIAACVALGTDCIGRWCSLIMCFGVRQSIISWGRYLFIFLWAELKL